MGTTTATEHPILFRPELVRKILDGKKHMTRRPVKPQPVGDMSCDYDIKRDTLNYVWDDDEGREFRSPFGYVGDVLWVREAFDYVAGSSQELGRPDTFKRFENKVYRADGCKPPSGKWTPSIHMPKWLCRLRLEITDVRVERVQDISEADAVAEGMERIELTSGILPDVEPPFNRVHPLTSTYAEAFQQAWNAAYPGSWDRNDWVWCITFKKITP